MTEQASIHSAVYAVGAMAVSATASQDHAVSQSARCIAEFVDQRRALNLDLDLALPELRKMHQALGHALDAREAMIIARLGLVKVPAKVGVSGFGPDCPCEGIVSDPTESRTLKAVA